LAYHQTRFTAQAPAGARFQLLIVVCKKGTRFCCFLLWNSAA
jgi:hypothetical protein